MRAAGPYMFGQFAFEGVAVDEPVEGEPDVELDADDGVFVVVVLVAAWAATPPPRISAPVMAVAAMAFRMGCIVITSFPLGGQCPFKRVSLRIGCEARGKPP
jgi:hypothetical protein